MGSRRILRRQGFLTSFPVFCLLASIMGAAVAQERADLPGGASSLRETYQDWLVACVQNKTKRCALSQHQNQQNGQRVLAIEVVASPDGMTATGILVLPFGLALGPGVTLEIDDEPSGTPVHFNTCLPDGCHASLGFEETFLSALRAGETLKVSAETADSNQPVSFSISLRGFSAAFDRVVVLME